MQTDQHIVHLYSSSYSHNADYRSDGDIVFATPRIAYVVSGKCTMTSCDGQNLTINAGDVWLLPKNKPYRSSWQALPTVEFIFLEFDVDHASLKLNRFATWHSPEFYDVFKRTQDYCQRGNTVGALCGLFQILQRFLPDLCSADTGNDRLQPALNRLHANYATPISVPELARACAMSPSYFYSVFRAATGQSPIEYKNALKLSHAVRLIRQGETLETVCDTLGFTNPAFLRRMIKKSTGLMPKEIKRNALKM